MTARRTLAVAAVAASLWGCAAQKDTSVEAARPPVRAAGGKDSKRAGLLQVSVSDFIIDGRIGRIRGAVANTFDQPIEGIRYVVTIYESEQPAKILDRWQSETDTTLAPGERVPMRLDVDSASFGTDLKARFTVQATPVKLAGQPVPPPENWRSQAQPTPRR
jgi:hypothetical protein